MKEFLKKNKSKIIAGGSIALIMGAIIGSVIMRNRCIMNDRDICFGFNNLEEALNKFQELSINAPNGTIALWNKGMEGYEYLVQDLS